jgi:CRP-like cAMP-binding protein
MTGEELTERYPGLTGEFSADDCRALLEVLTPVTVQAGEVLMEHGQQTDTMYLIESGLLAIRIDDRGEKLLLGRGAPGAVVGEIAMIEPGPASATVAAMEDTALLALSHDDFEKFRNDRPEAGNAMLQSISLDLVRRLRESGQGLLWRIGEHEWMKLAAQEDRKGWFRRMATLVVGMEGESA